MHVLNCFNINENARDVAIQPTVNIAPGNIYILTSNLVLTNNQRKQQRLKLAESPILNITHRKLSSNLKENTKIPTC